jgi:nitrogen fixation/metabolism regulation signal transduction histidine kinase
MLGAALMTRNTNPEQALLPRQRKRLAQRLFWASGICLLILLAMAFAHISGAQSGELNPRFTIPLVLGTLALLLALSVIVFRDAFRLFKRARDGVTGTRLQRRILTMFCAVSIIPTFIVALFSILFFNIGVKNWFDDQVSQSLVASKEVAQAYLEAHKDSIRSDATGIAANIRNEYHLLGMNPVLFERLLSRQASARNLSEAIIFNRERVLARTVLSFSLIFERLPETVLERADANNIVILSQDDDKIQGVIQLTPTPPTYLLITRQVDPAVLNHMQKAAQSAARFSALQTDMNTIQLQFSLTFGMLALLLLLAATWAGMRLAIRVISPIAKLSEATEKLSGGDYAVRVPEGPSHDEIGNLARSFNHMAAELSAQRRELLETNRKMVAAQRTAAWADVARRIAHEIKNPLTPITLSTERLRKKFGKQITEDRESYARYLDTIARHVSDIGNMVEEFVNFARMPKALLKPEALNMLVRKVVFSEKTAHPDIQYRMELAEENIQLHCDSRLLSQALLNVLKNAAEAFETLPPNAPRTITIYTAIEAKEIQIRVHDSGPGFPEDNIAEITEPYVTTREKGTGLGLAIVRKTVEEHGGRIMLRNHPEGGAEFSMLFSHAEE